MIKPLSILFILLAWHTGIAQDSPNSKMYEDADSLDLTDTTRVWPERLEIGVDEKSTLEYPSVENTAFEFGEHLVFKIRYGFIRAGTAEMKVLPKIDETGRQLYHIQTTARSLSSFNWIYKVDDVVNSFVDFKGFYPVRFEKKLREGSYKADLFVDYFHEDSLARVEFIRLDKDRPPKNYDVSIPPFVHDILSAFYFIRTQDLKIGESLYLSNHEKKKVYDLEVKVHKRETIKVSAGKFRCLVVEPLLQGDEALFKHKGRLKIWLTDDERRIPVQMKTKILVGSITTELIDIKGVNKEIAAKIR